MYINYTMQELWDELDVIEVFENPGSALRGDEVTKKQAQLYNTLGVAPQTTLSFLGEFRFYGCIVATQPFQIGGAFCVPKGGYLTNEKMLYSKVSNRY